MNTFCRTVHSIAVMSQIMILTGAIWAQATPAAPPAGDSGKSVDARPGPVGDVPGSAATPKIFEDFSTPSLQGSDLKASGVLVGGISDYDSIYTREITRVKWRPADPIDLYIIKPDGIKKPPVILYLYSYPFENDRFFDPAFCTFLTKNGFAAVLFASALTGQRYHDVPMKEWFVSRLQESIATSAHDVQMILNYLATRDDLDMDHVGMFGDGSGASIAILAASVDPRIKALDLLDPWGDWPDWIAKSTLIPEKERPDFLKPEWLAGVAPLDPVKWLPQLKTQKIRIQNVTTVTVTPNEAKRKIEAAAPRNAKIIRYDDAKAFLSAAAGGTGFDWIKEETQPGVKQQYHARGVSRPPAHSADVKTSAQ